MEYDRLNHFLNRAKIIHTGYLNKVDFNTNNLKHALYLLQGGALTCATTAFKLNLEGYHVPTTQQKRMIDEIVDLVNFFEELGDNSRQLKAWFGGRAVSRTNDALSIVDRAKRNLVSVEVVKEIDSKTKELNHIISEWAMHPSIKAVRANSTKRDHLFYYDHSFMKPAYNVADFGAMFINPCLYTILLPARMYLLTKEEFDELFAYTKEIDSINL